MPLALAPQLYGLADRFQLRTDLAEQLLLWLSTVDAQPAVLCELVRAAHTLCPAACRTNLYGRTGLVWEMVEESRTFGSWPVDAVVAVIAGVEAAPGVAVAQAWMEAQPQAAKQRRRWPQLLAAVQWQAAATSELDHVRRDRSAAAVPGLLV